MDKVFILTEEVELSNGVREFDIIGVYAEEHVAQGVMEELIENDDYGIIEKLGVAHKDDYSFETNWDWSGLKYDISWHNIER